MKIKGTWTALFLLSCVSFAAGQEWHALDTLRFNERITAYSIDPDHRVYIGTASGNLHRFEISGEESEYFSAIANFEITEVAAWNRFKVFVFYEKPQEFYFLDRFNTVSTTYDLSAYTDDLITLCTPGVDNSLWALSSSYNELRKYNLQTRQLLFSNPLGENLNQVSHIRAFQNLLIISDKEYGLLFFDQYGNLLANLEISGIDHFQIVAGQLIFYSKGEIYFVDPFHPTDFKTIKAPKGAFIGVLKYEEDYFLIQQNRVLIFRRD